MNIPGYETLAAVLQAAYDQAATGKGKERHANDLPFHEQPMQQIARRRGIGFVLGQADKKSEEAQGLLERGDLEAFRREILGAINYLAGAVVFAESQRVDVTHCGSESQEFIEVPRNGHDEAAALRELEPDGYPGRRVKWHEPDMAPARAGRAEVVYAGDRVRHEKVQEGHRFTRDVVRWRYVD